jgi:HTH-type transcriptional regulator / antitoxin HigA
MDLRPIRTPEDHAWALKEIERLWNAAGTDTPDGQAFEILATLTEAYEKTHFPIPSPDPIQAIQFRLEQGAIQPKELLSVFRTRARMSEILLRKRHLSIRMIRRLHHSFQIPLECLFEDYKIERETGMRVARRASPVQSKAKVQPRGKVQRKAKGEPQAKVEPRAKVQRKNKSKKRRSRQAQMQLY